MIVFCSTLRTGPWIPGYLFYMEKFKSQELNSQEKMIGHHTLLLWENDDLHVHVPLLQGPAVHVKKSCHFFMLMRTNHAWNQNTKMAEFEAHGIKEWVNMTNEILENFRGFVWKMLMESKNFLSPFFLYRSSCFLKILTVKLGLFYFWHLVSLLRSRY